MVQISLSKYKDLLNGHTELRIQENSKINIGVLNGDVILNAKSSLKGISARVNNGAWGFASSSKVSDEEVRSVLLKAKYNSELLSSKTNKSPLTIYEDNCNYNKSFATTKTKRTQKEIIDFVRDLDSYTRTKYKNLKKVGMYINYLNMEKTLLTSTGGELYSFIPRTTLYMTLECADKEGNSVEFSDLLGGLGEFEDKFNEPKEVYYKIDEMYERLMDKCDGIYAEGGVKECIISSEVSGILAHEAIGHTVEADIVLGGSVASEYLNKEVASPIVNLVDFAHSAFGKACPVPIYVDDEGTKSEDVTVIENGILKSYMHNKETASHFNVKPTGNARAFEFSDEPLVRMRNTCILPGKDKLEDMISSIEDGYYFLSSNNGQADTTGEFMFGVPFGYEIKNGKLGRGLRDTTISGVAFDMLKTVTMISDELNWSSGGYCGKKQMITVGMGGPSIKCKINVGGR